jgi:hypothetical protein
MLPPTDPLGQVLTELLGIIGNGRTFLNLNPAAANCVGLYKL